MGQETTLKSFDEASTPGFLACLTRKSVRLEYVSEYVSPLADMPQSRTIGNIRITGDALDSILRYGLGLCQVK